LREWAFTALLFLAPSLNTTQSGQSLIEHSYRADSDLSPSGWEYAETLKDFVIQKYNKSLSERGIDGKSHRLVVCRLPQVLMSLNPHQRKDLDLSSNAMQPYRLAILDWVDVFATERQDHRKATDV